MKRVYLLSFLLLFLGGSLLAQNATNTKSDQLPAGFPVKQNTGNADVDNMNYENEKKEWIKNNPEKYNEITGNSKVNNQTIANVSPSISQADLILESEAKKVAITDGNILVISEIDFNTLSRDCQDYILNNPRKFSVKK